MDMINFRGNRTIRFLSFTVAIVILFTLTVHGREHNEMASFSEFPTLHPLIVHFPIVLLIFAVFSHIFSLFIYKDALGWVTLTLVFFGFAGAFFATNFFHPHVHDLSEKAGSILEKHEYFAEITNWSAGINLILLLSRIFIFQRKKWIELIIAISLGLTAYAVSMAGHYGAQLTHIERVVIQNNSLEAPDPENNHKH